VFRSPRLRVILRQTGAGLATLFIISIVAFGMMSIRTPEQVAVQVFGHQVTPQQINAFAQANELDKPLLDRYGAWLWNFAHGDMSTSYVTGLPVVDTLAPRFERTLILAVTSLLLAFPIGLTIGVFQAKRIGSKTDLTLLTGLTVLAAMPEFVVGIGLLFLFAVTLGWLPVDSATALVFASSFTSEVKAYALPVMTLVLVMIPYVARITRVSAREALGAPYTQAALLRGLSRRTVIWDHAMRNAGVPLVNVVSLSFVYLLTGVVVTETLFAFPGMGAALVQAVGTSDAFMVQAISVLMGVMLISVNLLADIAVAYLNPRLKAGATR
jgi:peptide/nickel transport system permease protein